MPTILFPAMFIGHYWYFVPKMVYSDYADWLALLGLFRRWVFACGGDHDEFPPHDWPTIEVNLLDCGLPILPAPKQTAPFRRMTTMPMPRNDNHPVRCLRGQPRRRWLRPSDKSGSCHTAAESPWSSSTPMARIVPLHHEAFAMVRWLLLLLL